MKKYLFCLTILIFNICLKTSAQCTSQGSYGGHVFSMDASVGNTGWSNTNDASASDNNFVNATGVSAGDITNYLTVTDFSFSIPSTATICGIEVMIENSVSGAMQIVSDNSVKLIKGGLITGNDYASSSPWSTSSSVVSYGGSTDAWGTSWTASDINASDFGIAVSANLSSSASTAQIDFISIKVYYNNSLSALPVEFIHFSANENFGGILLNWQTATEENNDYFAVEKSGDGINFKEIDKITGAGNSQSVLSYSYTDRTAVAGKKYYYRLKQIDFNGAYSYSYVISYILENNIAANTSFTISNNKIIITNPENNNLKVKIYNAQGKLLLQTNAVETPLQGLPKGVLVIEIAGNTGSKIFKILNF
jgi:hypothetical protein